MDEVFAPGGGAAGLPARASAGQAQRGAPAGPSEGRTATPGPGQCSLDPRIAVGTGPGRTPAGRAPRRPHGRACRPGPASGPARPVGPHARPPGAASSAGTARLPQAPPAPPRPHGSGAAMAPVGAAPTCMGGIPSAISPRSAGSWWQTSSGGRAWAQLQLPLSSPRPWMPSC